MAADVRAAISSGGESLMSNARALRIATSARAEPAAAASGPASDSSRPAVPSGGREAIIPGARLTSSAARASA
jgi:hypothetical protein